MGTRLILIGSLLVVALAAGAGEWSMTTTTGSDNRTQLKALGQDIDLLWPTRVAPGDQILLTKAVDTSLGVTFYLTYTFVGITGDSMNIQVRGSVQEKGQSSARPDSSFTSSRWHERASDGAFYFTTSDTKSSGYFKVARVSPQSPLYVVTLLKEPP
jgi:hypothetical protein